MYSEKRPWGEFHVLEEGRGFKVKRLTVNPGGILSLQSHKHRAEHWTVVNGTATATVDKKVETLSRGQYVDVPKGAIHRLANKHGEMLDVIEVQFGDYLGEDDIIRYEDVYSRA